MEKGMRKSGIDLLFQNTPDGSSQFGYHSAQREDTEMLYTYLLKLGSRLTDSCRYWWGIRGMYRKD